MTEPSDFEKVCNIVRAYDTAVGLARDMAVRQLQHLGLCTEVLPDCDCRGRTNRLSEAVTPVGSSPVAETAESSAEEPEQTDTTDPPEWHCPDCDYRGKYRSTRTCNTCRKAYEKDYQKRYQRKHPQERRPIKVVLPAAAPSETMEAEADALTRDMARLREAEEYGKRTFAEAGAFDVFKTIERGGAQYMAMGLEEEISFRQIAVLRFLKRPSGEWQSHALTRDMHKARAK